MDSEVLIGDARLALEELRVFIQSGPFYCDEETISLRTTPVFCQTTDLSVGSKLSGAKGPRR